jgi:hypothetical protein
MPISVMRTFRDWWVELLAAALFVLDFSILVAILSAYQGKPLPKWPLDLSFNTALSVLGAVFRGPVLFIAAEGIGQLKWQWLSKKRPLSDISYYDDATRGPWGSTKLLWVARWRDLLAFLGAFLTVASLAIDPFTQAVVGYYPCRVATTKGTSSISRTNSFFSQDPGAYANVPLSHSTRLAIEASFGDLYAILPTKTCSESFCTFPEIYHSIGMCNQCDDVTHEIQKSCWPAKDTINSPGGCNYTLPWAHHNSRSLPQNISAGYVTLNTVARDELSGTTEAWNLLSAMRYEASPSRIYGSSAKDISLGPLGMQGYHHSSIIDFVSAWPVMASRCYLRYCVRSYTATIDHGELRETLQSTSSNWSSYNEQRSPVLGTVHVGCLKPRVRSRLMSDGFISKDTEWMAWDGTYLNGTETQEDISGSSDLAIPVACTYQVQLLDSSLAWNPMEPFTYPLTDILEGSGTAPDISIVPSSSNLLERFYNNGSISVSSINRLFDNFTTAVTSYMRTLDSKIPRNISSLLVEWVRKDVPLNPVPGSPEDWNQPVTGQGFRDTTCINVRWPWLALPAVIFVGTLVFLVVLILKTTLDREREVWKSSQNALLWHGLDGSAKFECDTLTTKQDMDDRAKQIVVRLENTRAGWKIVQDE